jgi:hypothetical protein
VPLIAKFENVSHSILQAFETLTQRLTSKELRGCSGDAFGKTFHSSYNAFIASAHVGLREKSSNSIVSSQKEFLQSLVGLLINKGRDLVSKVGFGEKLVGQRMQRNQLTYFASSCKSASQTGDLILRPHSPIVPESWSVMSALRHSKAEGHWGTHGGFENPCDAFQGVRAERFVISS